MNEQLDLLESGVTSLLEEIETLRQENSQQKQEFAQRLADLEGENTALRESLSLERTTRESAAERIDALLQRLTKPQSE